MSAEFSFGMIAKNRRRELGLTQDELARRVGCAPITLRKIEADDLRPSVQIAERLAMALNVPLEERAAFVKLARTERVFEEISVTPMPRPEEIGSEDLSGRAIRGYALGERLGNGGMGAVYRAVQPLVEREVAIKIILPMYANHPDFIRRFEAEAQLVARLEHPHIVPLYDYWREPGVAYLIMRLLRGGSVQSLLRSGTIFSNEAILKMMEQIGSALSASHRAGVVHRDLKPANVLLDEDNNAYLADFGIAKNLSSPSSETQADMVIGSPDYISPEQIRSEFIRPQTDIYALGVMLYEMLTGTLPFRGPTPIDVMSQHLNTPLPLLAENRIGLPKALDDVIKHATAKDPMQRYENVELMLNDLRTALGAGLHEIKSKPLPLNLLTELDNPYKGLRAFVEGDAQDFYGRETLTQQLLIRLGDGGELSRFLTIVGPSGSGKSSVVKAGLIPALRRGALPGSENWFIVEMMPGAHPLEELEAALLRVAVNPPASLIEQFQKDSRGLIRAVRRSLPDDPAIELVLVIDQFEEVFTLLQDEAERMRFLGLLVAAILDENSRVRVILTMRADFIDRPLGYVDFGDLIHQRMEIVLPLTPDELESTIASPAERVGLQLESGLVAAILRDLGDQPGTLPLLQYALTELYEKRKENTLTRSAYQEIGGVLGALGRRAEEIFTALDEEEQVIARQVFLRLVTLGEGVEDTRRRVLIYELENLKFRDVDLRKVSRSFKTVLDAFGNARLLSFDRDPGTRGPTVEVAHEAIIREWPRLREWLEESRTLVRTQRQLSIAASEWMDAHRDSSFLLSGTKLAQYEGWTVSSAIALTQHEIDYLKASMNARDQREMEEAERLQRELETVRKLAETESSRAELQTRSAKQLRQRAVYLTGALILAMVAAIIAGVIGNRNSRLAIQNENIASTAQAAEALAVQERDHAESENKLSTSRELAAAAISNLEIDPERSIMLALQGLSIQHTSEVENALRQSLATSRVKATLTSESQPTSIAISPDGVHIAAGEKNGIVQIWDLQTGQESLKLNVKTLINAVEYTPDGSRLITGDASGYIKIWDITTGNLESSFLAHASGIEYMALSPDGSRLSTTSSTFLKIWDTSTSEKLFTLSDFTGDVTSVAFSQDGTRLATVDLGGNAIIWNIATGKNLSTFSVGNKECYFNALFNQDSTRLITSDSCGTIRFWDITGNKGQELFRRNIRSSGGSVSLNLSPNGTQLAVGENNSISIWDASKGFDLFVLPNDLQAWRTDFSSDGKLFTAGGYGSTIIKVWDLSLPGEKLAINSNGGMRIGDVIFNPDGTRLVTESWETGKVQIWDTSTYQQLQAVQDSDICCITTFSPDGKLLVTGSSQGGVKIRDSSTGEVIVLIGESIATQVVFSPDGTRIVTAGYDDIVKVWETNNGRILLSFFVRNQIGWVYDIAFSPDGKLIATASTDTNAEYGIVQVWDSNTGKKLFGVNDPDITAATYSLAFSPDGKYLAVGYGDNTAKVWDISSMKSQTQPMLTFRGHSGLVWDVAFSPDGSRLATAGFDGIIKLWDVSTGLDQGKEITTFFGHTAEVSGIAFSPDERYLASVSWDGTLRVYYTQIEDLIAAAKERVTRSLTTEECQKYLHVDVCPAPP
ncbi:protein kinase [Candidatus Villigracilis saccharophilus]|uniref:nSTAND1 domain-containing NTPase n=1 Tax=Candidatus Villigracilis saccharophilus TaxID=3140684 RepID=UPI0031365814|nr:protein kinase [Anaerolineales bacterium]